MTSTATIRRPRRRRRAVFMATAALALTGAAITAVPAFAWDEIVKIVVNCDGRYVEYTNTEKTRSVDINLKGVVGAEKVSVAPGQTVKIAIPADAVPGSTMYIEQRWTDGTKGYDSVAITVPDFASAAQCTPTPPPPVVVTPPPPPAVETPVVTPPPSCPLFASRITGLVTKLRVGNTDVYQVRLRNTGTAPASITMRTNASGSIRLLSARVRTVNLKPGGTLVVNGRVQAIKAGLGTIRVTFGSNELKCGSLSDTLVGKLRPVPPPVDVPHTV